MKNKVAAMFMPAAVLFLAEYDAPAAYVEVCWREAYAAIIDAYADFELANFGHSRRLA